LGSMHVLKMKQKVLNFMSCYWYNSKVQIEVDCHVVLMG
jgi:hypothetical protein